MFILVLVLSWQFNKPTQGVVKMGKPISDIGYNVSLSPVLQEGQYASFNYPAGLKPDKNNKPTSLSLQQNVFMARDIETWFLATSVSTLPNGDLNNNSSYTLRKTHPEEYKSSTMNVDGQAATIMNDTLATGFGEVAFIPHGPFVGIVSITGDDSNGTKPLQTAINLVLKTWQWQ